MPSRVFVPDAVSHGVESVSSGRGVYAVAITVIFTGSGAFVGIVAVVDPTEDEMLFINASVKMNVFIGLMQQKPRF